METATTHPKNGSGSWKGKDEHGKGSQRKCIPPSQQGPRMDKTLQSGGAIILVTAVGSEEQELILTAGKRPKICEGSSVQCSPFKEGGVCVL